MLCDVALSQLSLSDLWLVGLQEDIFLGLHSQPLSTYGCNCTIAICSLILATRNKRSLGPPRHQTALVLSRQWPELAALDIQGSVELRVTPSTGRGKAEVGLRLALRHF